MPNDHPALPYHGCRAHHDCFTCPFPDCLAQDTSGVVGPRLRLRWAVAAMAASAHDVNSIAAALGRHPATIRRHLARLRRTTTSEGDHNDA